MAKILSFVLVLAVLLAATASALKVNTAVHVHFDSFKKEFGKTYATPEEEQFRMKVFAQNVRTAQALSAANPHAMFRPNKFSDLTPQEFRAQYLNGAQYYAQRVKEPRRFPVNVPRAAAPPTSFDWREHNAVTPVNDQQSCGSCWAWSATQAVEGAHAIATGKLVALSAQQLVSCDTVDMGCEGGLMDQAYDWLLNNTDGALMTAESYPYTSGDGQRGVCQDTGDVGAVITGYVDLAGDEAAMAAWLAENGPISIAVDASVWQLYFGGVLTMCFAQQLNHGVIVVGYDDSASPPYWIVKNSWGATWGEGGYLRIEKGTNQCMMKEYAIAPTVNADATTTRRPRTTTTTRRPHTTTSTRSPGPTTTKSPSDKAVLIQRNCYNSGCTLLCSNTTTPELTCLPGPNGGSVVIECFPERVDSYSYTTSDCTGDAETASMPTHQCLASYLGYFENICTGAAHSYIKRAALHTRPHRIGDRPAPHDS